MEAAQYDMHEAETQLSRIIDRVEHGEEVIISRAGRPVAKVIPLPSVVERRGRGALKGQVVAAADWDAPETNQEIARDLGLSS
ncbi:type II toxin-antitoxin system Phd/YefM family antitoxin [Kribbella sp. VKM Ac-2568]|uniref:type II toxin-antitoxin system Phd/YefM family antitoxin n=1 Tax=Kribbella sp. VKM Ac-2568 TaxID=2512219 RepID=UPI0010452242|nr:type II toxin-antitoxin system prevent-host-death family antitoxin [Kribbella sp. VKM Ac-2568]TCM43486.1 prevent-host-death family protein [Kribbella sp. VKM Ac-2568]